MLRTVLNRCSVSPGGRLTTGMAGGGAVVGFTSGIKSAYLIQYSKMSFAANGLIAGTRGEGDNTYMYEYSSSSSKNTRMLGLVVTEIFSNHFRIVSQVDHRLDLPQMNKVQRLLMRLDPGFLQAGLVGSRREHCRSLGEGYFDPDTVVGERECPSLH
ncbi:hypothetical protein KC357_g231 [Hortaea werneckii]|nr:hypothetical protein KC357_g231 [Hortaea werneckii]